GRLVHQVASGADGIGDLAPEPGGLGQGTGHLAGGQQLHTGQLERLLLLLVAIEDVRAERRAFRGGLHRFSLIQRTRDGERLRARRSRHLDRARGGQPELLQRAVLVLLLADPDRRHALGAELAVRVQREDLAFLARELLLLRAPGKEPVEGGVHRAELLSLAHEQREQVGFVRSRVRGDDGGRERHWSGAFYSGSGPAGKRWI